MSIQCIAKAREGLPCIGIWQAERRAENWRTALKGAADEIERLACEAGYETALAKARANRYRRLVND